MTDSILLHHKFEHAAKTHPGHMAVITPHGCITYKDLLKEARRLACAIRPYLEKDVRVLICLEPGMDFISSILGVLFAGGTYVPLYRNDPVKRLQLLCRLPGAVLLITDPDLKADLGKDTPFPVLTVEELAAFRGESPINGIQSPSHACIMHTSGSSGLPKAIGISHRGILNFLTAMDGFCPLTEADRCALWCAPHFDPSIYEIWSAFFAGATLYIPEEQSRFIPEAFLSWLSESKITAAFIPPFMMEFMQDTPGPFVLRRLLTGVEPIPEPLLCRIKNKIPKMTLLNGYGPAEATVCATVYPVPDTPSRNGRAPVGKPLRHMDVVLTDDGGVPVPPGEKGEIVILGPQVSDGYIGIPPSRDSGFGKLNGRHCYRTGDLGKQLSDGNILFLGRKDFQIKFNGVRIEPFEVEKKITDHPGISRAALVVKPLFSGKNALVAYASAAKPVDPGELMQDLRSRLPSSMTPSALFILDRLPLTSQGKIDRSALIARRDPEPAGHAQEAAPPGERGEVWTGLARIWLDVLGIPVKSGNEDFLRSGGDSIAAARLTARINHQFNTALTLDLPFKTPGFNPLVEQVESALKNSSAPPASPAADLPSTAPFALMPDQELIWLFETLHPHTSVYHLPLVWDIRGHFDPARLEKAINQVILNTPALGLTFGLENGIPFQRWCPGEIRLSRSSAEQTGEKGEQAVQTWLDQEIQTPFDLENGPPVRAAILEPTSGHTVLCLTIHHLVFDGWSVQLLVSALNDAYNGRGRRHDTGEKQLEHLRRHVMWRNDTAARGWEARSRTFFKYYLEGIAQPPLLQAERGFDAATFPVSLSAVQYGRIKAIADAFRTTPFAVLLTIFQLTMALDRREVDQVTGAAYAGRDRLEAEPLTGCLMNTLVIRNTLTFQVSFKDVLEQMKRTLAKVFSHSEIPFRTVHEYLSQQGEGLFSDLFLMQTMPGKDLHLGDAKVFPRSHTSAQTHTDVILELYESEEGLSGWLKYRTALISRQRARDIIHTYLTVAGKVSEAPEKRLDTLLEDAFPTGSPSGKELGEDLQEDEFPISPMQHGMLMETLKSPQGAGCYIEQIIFDLESPIRPERFERAWQNILGLHQILRTGFKWQGVDFPRQFFAEPGEFKVEFNDWSEFGAGEQAERLDVYLQSDRRLGFNLDCPPLTRVALFRRGESKFTCVWTVHHSILDGRSMTYILRDLFLAYQNPGHIPERPTFFKEFILALHNRPKAPARSFWKTYLTGFNDPIVFPYRPDPEAVNGAIRQQHAVPLTTERELLALSPITALRLKKLCDARGLTLNALFMSTWAVLISHYTGKKDILFGATVSLRHHENGPKESTGLYINTLPVRIRIDPSAPFWDLVTETWQTWQEIRKHDYLSLTDIHAQSPITGGIPLSEIYYTYDYQTLDNSLAPVKHMIGCERVTLAERTPIALFLSIQGVATPELTVEYDRRKFGKKTSRSILNHFVNFLKNAADNPAAKLLDLPILSEAELLDLDRRLNGDYRGFTSKKCLHQLFEESAAAHRSRDAAEDGSTRFTYDRLNRRANQIARYLTRRGAGPGKRVLVMLPRSSRLIAVLLGVLKSGAAFIPMDTAYPPSRVEQITADAAPALVICESGFRDRLPGGPAPQILMDQCSDTLDEMADHNPGVPCDPENPAYIIYTSGSTGRPKGVVISHRNIVSFCRSAMDAYGIGPRDRVLQFASIGFDTSAEEIYPTLLSGACIVVKPEAEFFTPSRLFEFSGQQRISVMDLPTAYWHMVVDELEGLAIPPDLKSIIIGGEEANFEKVMIWLQHTGERIRLLNTYGPTETTVAATCASLSAQEVMDKVPIGRAFSNVTLAILNHFNQPAPPGVTGELYIGGPQVSEGYLNRPGETKAAFLRGMAQRSPWPVFKSGDMVRMLPSGQLFFMGRRDRQFKIRGFRVEPGDIESTAMKLIGVRTCAAVLDGTRENDPAIHLFAVRDHGGKTDSAALIEALKARLPEYMIPTRIHWLSVMPMTSSGKIDHKALSQKAVQESMSSAAPAPRKEEEIQNQTPYEQGIVEILNKILGRSDMDLEKNFFEAGGSSLTAIRFVSEIEKAFGIVLPVLIVFKAPVLKDLARIIQNREQMNFSALRAIRSQGEKPPIFFLSGTIEEPQSYGKEDLNGHPFYTLTVLAHKKINGQIIPMDVWEISRRNVEEILRAVPRGPYVITGFCRYSPVAYETAAQLWQMGKEVALLVLIDEFWREKNMGAFVGHHIRGITKFGLGSALKKIRPKMQEVVHRFALDLEGVKEKMYLSLKRPVPEEVQYNLMESAFWKAYLSYMPRPYPGNAVVLDSKNWNEKFGPRLRHHITGHILRVEVDATHRDWFKPRQIRKVIETIDAASPGENDTGS